MNYIELRQVNKNLCLYGIYDGKYKVGMRCGTASQTAQYLIEKYGRDNTYKINDFQTVKELRHKYNVLPSCFLSDMERTTSLAKKVGMFNYIRSKINER